MHLRIFFAFFELTQKCIKFIGRKTSDSIFVTHGVVKKTKSVDHKSGLGFTRNLNKIFQNCCIKFV